MLTKMNMKWEKALYVAKALDGNSMKATPRSLPSHHEPDATSQAQKSTDLAWLSMLNKKKTVGSTIVII